jgi:hypothetical protein
VSEAVQAKRHVRSALVADHANILRFHASLLPSMPYCPFSYQRYRVFFAKEPYGVCFCFGQPA